MHCETWPGMRLPNATMEKNKHSQNPCSFSCKIGIVAAISQNFYSRDVVGHQLEFRLHYYYNYYSIKKKIASNKAIYGMNQFFYL